MFTPWNEICVGNPAPWGMLNVPSEGSLAQQDGTIPPGGHYFLSSVYTRLHHLLRWWSLFYLERDPVSRNERGLLLS